MPKSLKALSLMMLALAALVVWMMQPSTERTLEGIDLYVFVPSKGAPEVTVIDTRTDRIATTLRLDRIPDQVLVSEVANRLVASKIADRSIGIVNPETGETEKTIKLSIKPERMVLSPEGWLLAVRDKSAGSVSVVSLHLQRQLAQVNGFEDPHTLTFGIGGDFVYVADRGTGIISTIDVAQAKVISKLPVVDVARAATDGEEPNGSYGISGLTHTPNGRLGFCAYREGHELAVMDLNDYRKIKTLALGGQPSRPWGTADGRFMMVANARDRTISVIDTGALEVVATLPGASDVSAINTGWFESVAFVMSRSEDKAVVLDLMKLKKVGDIPLPTRPGPGVVTPDGKKLYVALRGSDRVAVIDTRQRKVVSVIPHVGREPSDATMARSNNYCH